MISFLHPWLLAGLAAAAIPILLHLLARREPPTIVFPAVRYLVTTTREHQRRLKLQNWLLLCLRTLLLVLLVAGIVYGRKRGLSETLIPITRTPSDTMGAFSNCE